MNDSVNPISYLTKRLWRYSTSTHPRVVLYVVMFVVANAINFLEPLVIARILNTIQQLGVTSQSTPTIALYLVVLVLLTVGFWAFHGPARILEMKTAFAVRAAYKQHLLTGVMNLPLEWHADHHSGDTIDRIEKGTEALYHFTESGFEIIEAVVRLTSSFLVLSYYNLGAGYVVLGMIVVTVTLIMQFDRVLVGQYHDLNRAENRISAKIFDTISNITTVVILRVERLVASAIYQQIMRPFQLFVRNNKVNEAKWFLVSMCSSLMIALVLASYLHSQAAAGSAILVGTVYALYGYVDRIEGLFYRFAYKYSDILQQKAAVMNSEELTETFAHVPESKAAKLPARWQALQITGLRFSYEADGDTAHLDDISMAIRRGERIALVGASGSGKTTLLKLIRELYQPQRATIAVDGAVLTRGFADISASIALIPQDPEIFATTIRENITVGVQHSDAYVREFTDLACFTSVLERLPHGLDSSIVEKGVNLSGGERQRLALARGLMACSDKQIVLLDEPTSSVDSRNELKIYKNIFRAFADKTIISSIHRLHLLPLFDRIYFFRSGKLLAAGSLDELRASSKEFAALWDRYHKPGAVKRNVPASR